MRPNSLTSAYVNSGIDSSIEQKTSCDWFF